MLQGLSSDQELGVPQPRTPRSWMSPGGRFFGILLVEGPCQDAGVGAAERCTGLAGLAQRAAA
eukprot:11217282-Lingulodinium_polyedra.AAC.1